MLPHRSRLLLLASLLALLAGGAAYFLQGPVTAQVTACSDGIDNDGDGQLDALQELNVSALPQTYVLGDVGNGFGNPHLLAHTVNQAMIAKSLPYSQISNLAILRSDGNWNSAPDAPVDMPTVTKVCEILGYNTYVSSTCKINADGGRCNFRSPGDDVMWRWIPSINNFRAEPANPKYQKAYLASITCKDPTQPQCNDGKDNDGDGQTDMADSGCAKTTDNSEVPHDVLCTSLSHVFERTPQCQDGADNDGDGATDMADFSCSSTLDDDEANLKPQCDDGADNDGDGAIDLLDFSCANNKQDNDETNVKPQCGDAADNDGDGAIDHPADFGCASRQADTEDSAKAQCQDGIDNDGDGATDMADFSCGQNRQHNNEAAPKALCDDGKDNDADGKTDLDDPGCTGRQDNGETGACGDAADNDGDGAIDMADFSCSNPDDGDEALPKAQCGDGVENDTDGDIDFPEDVGCESLQDNVEQNPPAQCRDSLDNDQDGVIDYPADFSCSNKNDNDEALPMPKCDDNQDNDEDGLFDMTDPGCTTSQDNTEAGEQCKQASILLLNLEPSPFRSGQPMELDELRGMKLNVTYHSRLSLPTFDANFLKQFSIVWMHNGCGAKTTLLSSGELTAIRDYYLAGGDLVLSPGNLASKTDTDECTSRIAQISLNLGISFSGTQNAPKAACQSIDAKNPLFSAVARTYKDTSATFTLATSTAWGAGTPKVEGIPASSPQVAIIASEGTRGTAVVLSQYGLLRKQCAGTQSYRNLLGILGFHQTCACSVAAAEQPSGADIANDQSFMQKLRTVFASLLTWNAAPRITAQATTANPGSGFTCPGGVQPSVRTVQLAGAMGSRAYGGISVFDRSSTSLTLNAGDKVYVGGNGQVHWTDDEIHITAVGTQVLNYVVGGCSGHIDKTRTGAVDITSLFRFEGPQTVSAEFVDTCGSQIGHSSYTLSIVNCGTPQSSSKSTQGSSRSGGAVSSTPPNACKILQQSCDLTQCNDGIDNDRDGKLDLADEGCADSQDKTEQETLLPLASGSCTVVTRNRVTGTGTTVNVACPAGYSAVGGGWNEFRFGDYGIDGSWPQSNGKGWSCIGDQGAQYCYEQSCSAICCSDATVDTLIMEKRGPLKDVPRVSCPPGYTITGGGFQDGTRKKDEEYIRPVGENGWECYDDESISGQSVCYGICTKLDTAEVLSCQTIQVEQLNGPPMRATCPDGTIVTGGGFHDTSTGNDDEESSGPYGNGWECWEDNSDSEKAPGICYARCCGLDMQIENPPSDGACLMSQGQNVIPDTCTGTAQNGLCQTAWYKDIAFPADRFTVAPHVIVTARRVPSGTAGCSQGSTDHVVCKPEGISKAGFRLVCSGSPVKGACPGQDDWFSPAAADWTAIDKSSACGAQSGHNFKPSCTPTAANGFCNSGFGYKSTLTFPTAFADVPKIIATPEILSDQAGCVGGTTDTLLCRAEAPTTTGADVLCSGSPNDRTASCGADNGKFSQGVAGWLAMPSRQNCRVEEGSATAVKCNSPLSGGTCPTPFEVTVPFSPAFTAPPVMLITPSQVSMAPVCQGNSTGTDTVVCELVSVTKSEFTARCSGSFLTDACGAGTNRNYTSGKFSYLAIDAGCKSDTQSSTQSSAGGSSVQACVMNQNRFATQVIAKSKVGDGLKESDILGAPDGISTDFDGVNNAFGFVTLRFANPVKNMPGNDFAIHLTDFRANEPTEAFEVIVNGSKGAFVIGTIAPSQATPVARSRFDFDISASGMTEITSVSIRNATKDTVSHIGPDIDALENLTDCQTGIGSSSSTSSMTLSSSRSSSSLSSERSSSRPSTSPSSTSSRQTSSSTVSSASSYTDRSSRLSSVASSSASSHTVLPTCPSDTCAEGGAIVCGATGRTCSNISTLPCFECVTGTLSSEEGVAASSQGLTEEGPLFNLDDVLSANGFTGEDLGIGQECSQDSDCPTSLCEQGACTVCMNDEACHDGKTCVVLTCREPPRQAAPSLGEDLCGDGNRETHEECDDGNVFDGDGCSGGCELERGFCGDGTVQEALGEECEPAQGASGLFICDFTCRITASQSCGNSMLDLGEECDRGAENGDTPDRDCRSNCSLGRCGDGIVDTKTEECDDGNRVAGDGCNRTCIDESGTLAAGGRENPLTLGGQSSQVSFSSRGAGLLPSAPATPAWQNPAEQVAYVQQVPLGQTGPAALAAAAAGAATGVAWMRRKRSKK